MVNKRSVFLKEMGIAPVWRKRQGEVHQGEMSADAEETLSADASPASPSSVSALAEAADTASGERPIADMSWEELETAVSSCTRCGLCRNRTRTVCGVGDRNAQWLFIGEGPGYYEDQQGEPFVGRSGMLLDNMLAALELRRGSNAFIANIVKCRATDEQGKDRPPTPEEVATCLPYLKRQIELIRPQTMVALGKTAALSLLNMDPATPVGQLRGKTHRYDEIPLVVTYHPAYLLRQPTEKRKAWSDLCLAVSTHAQPQS